MPNKTVEELTKIAKGYTEKIINESATISEMKIIGSFIKSNVDEFATLKDMERIEKEKAVA